MKLNSSKQRGHQSLAFTSRRRAERLLTDFANAQDDPKALNHLLQRHVKDIEPDALMTWHRMGQISKFLRRAWDAKDDRTFNWFLWKTMELQGMVVRWAANSDEPPEHVTELEVAVLYMQRERHRAMHCPNPGCKKPYFFRKKKNQRFCSTECALPTQRESKRNWWNEYKAKKEKKR